MQKKIEFLLQEGKLDNQPEFQQIFEETNDLKNIVKTHQIEKETAKTDLQAAKEDALMETMDLAAFTCNYTQSKSLLAFHKAAYKLSKQRLCFWLQNFLSQIEIPDESSVCYKMIKLAHKKANKAILKAQKSKEKEISAEIVVTFEEVSKPKKEGKKKNQNAHFVSDEQMPTNKNAVKSADDLKLIVGIGAKVEVLLHNANVLTFKQLSKMKAPEIQMLLVYGGSHFARLNAASWPKQAKYAAQGKWEKMQLAYEKEKVEALG
jgi:predicted flap endonuclease-1-like 5' DNA nuclease